MSYLVTGGAGFIGSNLVAALLEEGVRVRVLDNFSTGKKENLAGFRSDQLEIVEADLRDLEAVRKAVDGMEYVLHQGALPSVPRSLRDPKASNDVNASGTLNVLIASRDAGVKRVVYASSSSIYGETPTLPKHEALPPDPLSPYAVSKLSGELYCKVFGLNFDLPVVCLRYFNVFGPRQDPTSQYAAVIPKFITALLEDRLLVVYGDGEQSRDFTYIQNVVRANLLACQAEIDAPQTLNVACQKRISLNEMIRMLERIIGKKAQVQYDPPRPGDIKHSLADISLARRIIGYEPEVDFEKGLRETVAWFQRA